MLDLPVDLTTNSLKKYFFYFLYDYGNFFSPRGFWAILPFSLFMSATNKVLHLLIFF